MSNGTEMLIVNMLKAFMPKEAAEKIAGMVQDGTFDRIGAIPKDLDALHRRLDKLDQQMAIIAAHLASLEGSFRNPLLTASGGPVSVGDETPLAEYRANGPGGITPTSFLPYNGHGGSNGTPEQAGE